MRAGRVEAMVRMKASLAGAFLLLAASAALYGQDTYTDAGFETWLLTKEAVRYQESATAFREVFSHTLEQGLPTWILLERLKEGAAKRIRPDRLVIALRAEAARLATAGSLLSSVGVRLDESRLREETLKAICVFLRMELGAGVIAQLVSSFKILNSEGC